MKIYIKLFLLLLLTAGTVGFTACAGDYLHTAEQKKSIDVIVKMKEAEFYKTVKAGAEAAAKEFDVNIRFNAPDDELDVDGQIALVNEAIGKKSDGIVLAASDYKKLADVVDRAAAANIPVIIIDSALDSDRVTSVIATDNRAAGRMVAQKLIEISGDECIIAIMNFVKGSASADEREEGFLKEMEKHPKIKIVAKEYCFSDSKLSGELTGKILGEHPEVNTFVGLNAMATEGVARTIQSRGLGNKIKIIGVDSTPEEIDFIEDNVIQAAIVQRPFNMGYLGVKYAFQASEGKSVPKLVDTGSKVIDKSNMYTPENQKLLFPFVK